MNRARRRLTSVIEPITMSERRIPYIRIVNTHDTHVHTHMYRCRPIYHPTLNLIPWSLDLFIHVPFQLHGEHTVLQPFWRIELIVHIAISVLPGTHFHLSQVKHLRVKCLAHRHNILTMPQD